jgi:hypothetical protein
MISTTLAAISLKIQPKLAVSVVSTSDIHPQLPIHMSLSESAVITAFKPNRIVKLCVLIADCGAVAAHVVQRCYR